MNLYNIKHTFFWVQFDENIQIRSLPSLFLPSSTIILKPVRLAEESVWKTNVIDEPVDSIAAGIDCPHNLDPIMLEDGLSPSLTSR